MSRTVRPLQIGLLLLTGLALGSCKPQSSPSTGKTIEAAFHLEKPKGFPRMPIPDDNPLTRAKVELGKRLFQEPLFSRDSSLACVSCHLPELAFTDGKKVSRGVEGQLGFRNAPTLANVGYQNLLFADGGVRSLELQVLVPFDTHFEFDKPLPQVVSELAANETYDSLFQLAFREGPTVFGITRAIAAFERTLVFGNSKYDQAEMEQDFSMWTDEARWGRELFFSKEKKCANCHVPPLFTDQQFYSLFEDEDDEGRYRITRDSANLYAIKTPTLRNVSLTAPYMHDGRFSSLEEVLVFYDTAEFSEPKLAELSISKQEREALIAFLATLTEKEFEEKVTISLP